jgi:hypothetical protein
MAPELVITITAKAIAGGTGILFLIGFIRGVIKFIQLKKRIKFTYTGEEQVI